MKSRNEENVSEAYKIASGGDIVAYDPIKHKRIILNTNEATDEDANEGENHADNKIIQYPIKTTGMAAFIIQDTITAHDDFNRILFVSKACLKKDHTSYPFKTYIHVEEENGKKIMVSTDGIRLHAAAVDLDLLPGNYTIKTGNKSITLFGPIESNKDNEYPNWKKVVPTDYIEKAVINFNDTSLKRDLKKLGIMSKRMYSIIKTTNKLINLYYLDDLLKETWNICIDSNEKNSAVLFSQNNTKKIFAIIMPMNPED